MRYNLSEVCEIQQGRNISASNYNQNGSSIYLSLKDVESKDFHEARRTDVEMHSRYFVQPDNVLFSIRGKFNAYVLPKNIDMPVIASSMFVILRPKLDIIDQSYLWWFLNHPATQGTIQRQIPSNSRMPFISLRDLRELEIEVPSIDKQRNIIHIYNLHKREMQLTNKLIELKKQLTQKILFNSIKS